MKNTILGLIVALALLPTLSFAQATPVTQASVTQQLIALLMEKVKELQAQLDVLLKAKTSSTLPVAIVSQNDDYKKEVSPLIDLSEQKNAERKILVTKLDEAKCLRPFRTLTGGVTKFYCRDNESDTSPVTYKFSNDYTATDLAIIFKNPVISNNSITVPGPLKNLNSEVLDLARKIEAIDADIADTNSKIQSLKLRYGI